MLRHLASGQVPAPHTTQAYGKGALNLTLHSIASRDTVLVVKPSTYFKAAQSSGVAFCCKPSAVAETKQEYLACPSSILTTLSATATPSALDACLSTPRKAWTGLALLRACR